MAHCLFIEIFDILHNRPHSHFHHVAMPANNFVHNGVRFGEIENEVEFAHIAEVAVEGFDEAVDYFEGEQFIGIGVDAGNEI